ncbi:hypothetical protein ABKN59_003482 [Abortiporus biennis]
MMITIAGHLKFEELRLFSLLARGISAAAGVGNSRIVDVGLEIMDVLFRHLELFSRGSMPDVPTFLDLNRLRRVFRKEYLRTLQYLIKARYRDSTGVEHRRGPDKVFFVNTWRQLGVRAGRIQIEK